MSASQKVDYKACAKRHIVDARILLGAYRKANAGQLFGFSVECGLKALLVHSGATVDSKGNIKWEKTLNLREHMPKLAQVVNALIALQDGRVASVNLSKLPHLNDMHDWEVDHRYYREAEIPIASSLANWELAAHEINDLLDDVFTEGLL